MATATLTFHLGPHLGTFLLCLPFFHSWLPSIPVPCLLAAACTLLYRTTAGDWRYSAALTHDTASQCGDRTDTAWDGHYSHRTFLAMCSLVVDNTRRAAERCVRRDGDGVHAGQNSARTGRYLLRPGTPSPPLLSLPLLYLSRLTTPAILYVGTNHSETQRLCLRAADGNS